jgi:polar amino acid transport system substrate-binding protein
VSSHRSSLRTAATFVVLLALVAGCSWTGRDRAAAPETALRVGVTPDAAPMVYREGGEIAGLEADLARALGAALGRAVRFVELPRQDLIPGLQGGRVDIVTSALPTAEAPGSPVRFSQPYMVGGLAGLVPENELASYSGRLALISREVSVAVQRGTAGHRFCREHLANARTEAYDSVGEAYEALASNRVDMMVHDAPVVWDLAARHPGSGLLPLPRNLTIEYYGWAFKQADAELADSADRVLNAWKRNGRLARMVAVRLPGSG